MKLQDKLKDVSTVPNAFDIKHFSHKGCNNDCIFTSFQIFSYIARKDCFEYTYNIYSSTEAYKGSDIYEAFKELVDFIDKNLLDDGTLDPKVLVNVGVSSLVRGNPQGTINKGWSSGYTGANPPEVVEFTEEDPLYCNCKQPNISRSHAMGVQFDYCKTCLKERVAKITTLRSSSYNYYGDVPF